MVEELDEPGKGHPMEALRVGKRVAVSFVNYAYWKNRYHFLRVWGSNQGMMFILIAGSRATCEIIFRSGTLSCFAKRRTVEIIALLVGGEVFHRGDWVKTCKIFSQTLRAGLAIYELIKN